MPPCSGALESPPDERDWPVHALYAATGTEAPAALPAVYHVPALLADPAVSLATLLGRMHEVLA